MNSAESEVMSQGFVSGDGSRERALLTPDIVLMPPGPQVIAAIHGSASLKMALW
jgi:hypothetical protein